MVNALSGIPKRRFKKARGGGTVEERGNLMGQKRSIGIVEDHGDGSFVEQLSDPLLTTRNDWSKKSGYKQRAPLQPFTGQLNVNVNYRVTESQNATVPTYFMNAVSGPRGTGFVAGPSPSLMVLDRNGFVQPFPLDRKAVVGMASRPRGKKAPYVRSWLTPQKRKDAVDLEIRGNMAYNEWQNDMPEVYMCGNGFAMAGAAYISGVANPDTF